MIYNEWKDSDGFIYKEWGNDDEKYHRESGPALICYYPDGSIKIELFYVAGKFHRDSGPASTYYHPNGRIILEEFYIAGEFLGDNKKGFWALWEILDEEGRQAPDILKCLVRYS